MNRRVVYLFSALCFYLPSLAWGASLGDLADKLYAPTAFITQFLIFGCYAVGVALALAGIMQVKNHQQNPKLVPLSTPITLFILSAVLLVLPFISKQGGVSWSAAEQVKKDQQYVPNTSPFSDAEKDRQPFASPPPNAVTPDPAPAEEGSGHWSTKH